MSITLNIHKECCLLLRRLSINTNDYKFYVKGNLSFSEVDEVFMVSFAVPSSLMNLRDLEDPVRQESSEDISHIQCALWEHCIPWRALLPVCLPGQTSCHTCCIGCKLNNPAWL